MLQRCVITILALKSQILCISFNVVSYSTLQFQKTELYGRDVYLARTDLVNRKGLTGSKAYKFWRLSEKVPFPRRLLSVGGSQSNAMLAIAQLASNMNSEFTYFTGRLPKALSGSSVDGNFKRAKDLGMKV
jgi:1-aminocyclopropane-1-carboxylate deaminase